MSDTPPVVLTPINRVRHSLLGIASFAISIVVGFTLFALFIVAGVLVRRGSAMDYPGQSVVGVIAIFLLGLDVVAVGLGIAGICQSAKKRVLAILGTVFSGLTIVGTVAMMIVGVVYATRMA